MPEPPPFKIKITNPQTGVEECAILHAEHAFYWVYLFRKELNTILVLKSEAHKYWASAEECPGDW